MNEIKVEKNEENELPIPHIWRSSFKEIVKAFVKGDYSLSSEIKNVNSISDETTVQIKEYIEDYGEELIELPNETWESSVYISYGNYWNVLIDLFTKEEGLSDMVISAEIREKNEEYEIEVKQVYVP
ncbi:hypothetical protein SHK09_14855 [Polaribacter sp. PL03]|uniref:DUF7668 domain-containing protein n=2 Tax=unclassified Polaribacter TaxID=196858 RepID=UPI0029CF06AB|nr:hypothetical protein [Polaribacter sp. PL03]MDX6748074.1 hypothetical protein [Polaribacter sp. PL03]